jgi:DNA-binding transcriptional LysR family regulator
MSDDTTNLEILAELQSQYKELRSFVAVANAGSFTAVAEDPKGQRQSSRDIDRLQKIHKCELIVRRGKRVELTRAGEKFAKATRRLFARIEDMEAEAHGRPPSVTVSSDPCTISWWVLPQFPHDDAFGCVTTRNRWSAQIVKGLHDAQFDLGIMRTCKLSKRLAARALGTIELALYVPKHLMPAGRRLSVKKLLETIPIGIAEQEPFYTECMEPFIEDEGIEMVRTCTVADFSLLHTAVRAGMCAGILPTLARESLPQAKFSEHHDAFFNKYDGRMSLAWSPELEHARPKVFAMIPSIVRAMHREPDVPLTNN